MTRTLSSCWCKIKTHFATKILHQNPGPQEHPLSSGGLCTTIEMTPLALKFQNIFCSLKLSIVLKSDLFFQGQAVLG